MVSDWPLMAADMPSHSNEGLVVDEESVSVFRKFQELVRAVRNARAEYKVDPGKKLERVHVKISTSSNTESLRSSQLLQDVLEKESTAFCILARADAATLKIEFASRKERQTDVESSFYDEQVVHLIIDDGVEVFLPIAGMIDPEKELKRLEKQASKLRKDITLLEGRLSSAGFRDRAPPQMVVEVNNSLRDYKDQLLSIENVISGMKQ